MPQHRAASIHNMLGFSVTVSYPLRVRITFPNFARKCIISAMFTLKGLYSGIFAFPKVKELKYTQKSQRKSQILKNKQTNKQTNF